MLVPDVDDLSKINEREQYWMDFYQSYNRAKGYNLAIIAASNRVIKRSPEFVEALRVRGRLLFSGPNNPNFGKKPSEETKRRISEAKKRRLVPTELQTRASRERLKKVAQIDMNTGETIRTWESANEAGQPFRFQLILSKKLVGGTIAPQKAASLKPPTRATNGSM